MLAQRPIKIKCFTQDYIEYLFGSSKNQGNAYKLRRVPCAISKKQNSTKNHETRKENIRWCLTSLTIILEDNAADCPGMLDSFQSELIDLLCFGGEERQEIYLMAPPWLLSLVYPS